MSTECLCVSNDSSNRLTLIRFDQLNDTIMLVLTTRQNAVLIIPGQQKHSPSDVFSQLQATVHAASLITIKRDLDQLLRIEVSSTFILKLVKLAVGTDSNE